MTLELKSSNTEKETNAFDTKLDATVDKFDVPSRTEYCRIDKVIEKTPRIITLSKKGNTKVKDVTCHLVENFSTLETNVCKDDISCKDSNKIDPDFGWNDIGSNIIKDEIENYEDYSKNDPLWTTKLKENSQYTDVENYAVEQGRKSPEGNDVLKLDQTEKKILDDDAELVRKETVENRKTGKEKIKVELMKKINEPDMEVNNERKKDEVNTWLIEARKKLKKVEGEENYKKKPSRKLEENSAKAIKKIYNLTPGSSGKKRNVKRIDAKIPPRNNLKKMWETLEENSRKKEVENSKKISRKNVRKLIDKLEDKKS